jgi:ribokinase
MGVRVLGSINLDYVCRVERLPLPGETVLAHRFDRFPGGKGANQAAAAAAWGASTALIGAVGEDEAGDFLLAHLARRGVDTRAVTKLADVATGVAHICVADDGENTIVVIGGANRALAPSHIPADRPPAAEVRLSQMEAPIETVAAFLGERSAGRGLAILNAAPALPGAERILPLVDLVVVNQSELATLGRGGHPTSAAEAISLARRLITHADQTVVVTMGAAGALAVTANDHHTAEGRTARVEDTTGAGDCFCGVLAASLAEGKSLADAMGWANLAAALSTERAGAAVSPTLRAEAESRAASRRP